MSKKTSLIKKEDLISDVITKFPKSVELLSSYGLNCVGCFANQYETIEIGAKVHEMTDKEIEQMLKEVNKELKK